MDTEKPCHKRPEPNVAGGKVVVDSFSENEEVAMLFEEIGGGKICPLRNELYVFLLTVIYYGLVYNDAKIQINLYNCKIFEKRFGTKYIIICQYTYFSIRQSHHL